VIVVVFLAGLTNKEISPVAHDEFDLSELLDAIRAGGHPPEAWRHPHSAVAMLCDRFGVSERRACTVVGQHRSTQRLTPPTITDDEQQLREFLRDFSKRRPRWGWRRAAKAARRSGWRVIDKRVRRLWRDEGLRVPQRRRKKRLTGIGTHIGAMCPIRPQRLVGAGLPVRHHC